MKTYIVAYLISGEVEVFDKDGLDWQEWDSGIHIIDTSKDQRDCIAIFRNEVLSYVIEVREDKLTSAEKQKIRR